MNTTFATVGPSQNYDFPVTLTNNDSAFCSPRTFSVSTTAGVLSPSSVSNVAPGGQGGSTLTLTGGSLSGDKIATVSVQDESTATVSASLTVDADPPTIQDLAGTYQRKGKNHRIQLSWSGSDTSGIGSYEIYRGGTIRMTSNQSSYTDSLPGSPAASYNYQVRAIDIHGNDAYSSTITVSTTGGDDGDGGGGGNDKPCRGKKCSN